MGEELINQDVDGDHRKHEIENYVLEMCGVFCGIFLKFRVTCNQYQNLE